MSAHANTPPHTRARRWAMLNGAALALTTAGYGGYGAYMVWALLRLRDPQPGHIGMFFVAAVAVGVALASGALLGGQRWVYRRLRRGAEPLDLDMRLILVLGSLVAAGGLGLWAWWVTG